MSRRNENIFEEKSHLGRKIGVTLNESLLMSPSKSVTAIIGLSDKPCGVTSGDCGYCGKRDCAYRKEEK